MPSCKSSSYLSFSAQKTATMETMSMILVAAFSLLLSFLQIASVSSFDASQIYIVYMGSKEHDDPEVTSRENHQLLASVMEINMDTAKSSMIYSYSHGFKGFAAEMTESKAAVFAQMPGVVSVFPNRALDVHTTHSWNFLGFPENNSFWDIPKELDTAQEDVIIGMIDTGIWPESLSFSDHGMSPVPARWKGICQTGEQFPSSICNKKLIGARFYNGAGDQARIGGDLRSARDTSGHGTHTASIAAGRYVGNMSYNGSVSGEGRGGAPFARIAVYRACWIDGTKCFMADVLAAFDDAIRDGVDILSLSLGYGNSLQFDDAVSVGSFHAVKHGITVVASAGNTGRQGMGSVNNEAPWVITVAAASTDRDFDTTLNAFGNGTYWTPSLSLEGMKSSAEMVVPGGDPLMWRDCTEGSLDSRKVAGKVVVCHYAGDPTVGPSDRADIVKKAGGAGMIIIHGTEPIIEQSYPFSLPTAYLGVNEGIQLLLYLNSTKISKALISAVHSEYGRRAAPAIAAFSSVGPSTSAPDILKPDVAAPGLNILASWSPAKEGLNYKIMSGTSMSCPHVTGIVALIKASHPSWSPSAIKSAIMTTATQTDNRNGSITVHPTGNPANPFYFGAGLVNPIKALDPGLVYDAEYNDYVSFLCAMGFNSSNNFGNMFGNTSCPRSPAKPANLNLPSITISNFRGSDSAVRVVTNVGDRLSVYKVTVDPPKGVTVKVVPELLRFRHIGEKLQFTVEFRGKIQSNYAFGYLSWVNAKHSVTSPITLGKGTAN